MLQKKGKSVSPQAARSPVSSTRTAPVRTAPALSTPSAPCTIVPTGLGGGFAGYGIYPEYADYYAFHVFYDTQAAKEECEREIERHFDIVNLSKILTRRHPRITDALMIWRYFVTPCRPSWQPASSRSVSSPPALSSASITR